MFLLVVIFTVILINIDSKLSNIFSYVMIWSGVALFLYAIVNSVRNHIKYDLGQEIQMVKIKKGHHRSNSNPFGIFIHKKSVHITNQYIFNPSMVYYFKDKDDEDINKLFGISFRLFPKCIDLKKIKADKLWFKIGNIGIVKGLHWNSTRWGWNSMAGDGRIKLYAYLYKNGIRKTKEICSVNVTSGLITVLEIKTHGKNVFLTISQKNTHNHLGITDVYKYTKSNEVFSGFILHSFFGGNRVALNDIFWHIIAKLPFFRNWRIFV